MPSPHPFLEHFLSPPHYSRTIYYRMLLYQIILYFTHTQQHLYHKNYYPMSIKGIFAHNLSYCLRQSELAYHMRSRSLRMVEELLPSLSWIVCPLIPWVKIPLKIRVIQFRHLAQNPFLFFEKDLVASQHLCPQLSI